MKKVYFILVLMMLLGITAVKAQNTMVVTKNDGTKVEIKIADIQDVTFVDDAGIKVLFEYYTRYWLHTEQWMKLKAVVYQEDEKVSASVKWSSTDESIATVNNGVVTAVSDGECEILAEALGVTGRFQVYVTSENQFDMNVYNIGNRSCSFSISPKDPKVRYYYNLKIQSGPYSIDNMDQHGSEEQNILHYTRDWWNFVGGMYDMCWQDYMNEYELVSGYIVSGSEETHSSGLTPGKQFCLYAFGMDEDGEMTTPVEVTKFYTSEPQPSDMTFECSFDNISSSDATFTITPSNQDDPYFVNVQRGSYVEWFINNDCMNDMVESLTGSFNPDLYPECFCQGTSTRQMTDFLGSVRSDEDYYVIVFGWDEGQTTPVQVFKFHTNP